MRPYTSAGVSLFSALRDEGRGMSGPAEAGGTLSDAQIIALARESHAEAFEFLYSAFKGRLYTFLLRMVGDPELADDLTHDVFAKALKLLPTLTREHKVLPWLYRVANNAAIDQLRRRRRFAWLRIGSLSGTGDEPQEAGGHERVPEQAHVQAVLRTLPPENSSALLLHALEGYSYKEIAEIQGVSMTAVRSRIARARAAFRERYSTP
ncbi:MAG: RNA polymerase sigma factor [Chloroflexi bacterium]|nr:RNA polymerase sigma factor [Chloroflexota bacterium]